MIREPHLTVLVTDWPAFGKSMAMSLTASLYPDQESIEAWASRRFGPGRLVRVDDGDTPDQQWEYRREVAGRGLLQLFTGLLHRSYS